MSIVQQCILLKLNRSSLYYKSNDDGNEDVTVVNEIRDIYEQHPFYGYRRIHNILGRRGFKCNIKKVRRLMRLIGLRAIYPHKKTSIRNQSHKVYPYLLRGLKIERPNQVWKTDITYIKIGNGFIYLVCIIDVFSRRIMGFAVSLSLDTKSCIEAYEMARRHHKPEILNSDQGCQFTSDMWTQCLEYDQVKISMDGRGRWADNIIIERFWRSIKYEDVFLHCYEDVETAKKKIAAYINFYNNERPHQALKYKTPNEVFNEALGIVSSDVPSFDLLRLAAYFSQLEANNYTQTREARMGV